MSDPITRALEGSARVRRPTPQRGALADYIPELARADPALFGIVLESHDGDAYAAGDADAPFTIQSISKPFVLRARARGARARRGRRARRRRAERRAVQRDQPRAGHRAAPRTR